MAYSSKTYTGDGVTKDFTVTFDYLDQSHVKVRVDKVFTDDVGSNYKITWINSQTLRVDTVIDGNPPTAGAEIELIRQTPIASPAVVFGGGASLSSANLNKNSEYLTFALQEATDANEAFTKLYLGSFAAFPTTDNDGDPLQIGAVIYYTPENALYYWTGSGWIVGESTLAAQIFRDQAEQARDAAQVFAVNASASATTASASATAASASEVAAAASEVAAAASAAAAAISAAEAAAPHTHAISEITGLQAELDGKAAISHAHAITDVTGLQTALNGKAALAAAQMFSGAQGVNPVTLTDGATINTDASQSNIFTVTLAGNRVLANPTNLVAGKVYTWRIVQDATGGRTLGFGAGFKFAGGTPTLSTAANAIDTITGLFDGTQLLCVFSGDFKT